MVKDIQSNAQYMRSRSVFVVYLFAGEPHKHIPHDALPLAPEHTFLESMEELKVLLDEKPQRAGKRTKDRERRRGQT